MYVYSEMLGMCGTCSTGAARAAHMACAAYVGPEQRVGTTQASTALPFGILQRIQPSPSSTPYTSCPRSPPGSVRYLGAFRYLGASAPWERPSSFPIPILG